MDSHRQASVSALSVLILLCFFVGSSLGAHSFRASASYIRTSVVHERSRNTAPVEPQVPGQQEPEPDIQPSPSQAVSELESHDSVLSLMRRQDSAPNSAIANSYQYQPQPHPQLAQRVVATVDNQDTRPYVSDFDAEEDREDDEDDAVEFGAEEQDVEVLKPSCEDEWRGVRGFDGQEPFAFRHSSRLEIHRDVLCVPLRLVKFSQGTVSAKTSAGKPLDHWISKFRKAGYYQKKHLPTFVKFSEDWYLSVDNRRIYCAKQAGITFVPARVYHFNSTLPSESAHRFIIRVDTPFFKGLRVPHTWGEAGVFRALGQANPEFTAFGSSELPEVVHRNTSSPL